MQPLVYRGVSVGCAVARSSPGREQRVREVIRVEGQRCWARYDARRKREGAVRDIHVRRRMSQGHTGSLSRNLDRSKRMLSPVPFPLEIGQPSIDRLL